MHGRPREAKHKLKDPKVAEAHKKKVRHKGTQRLLARRDDRRAAFLARRAAPRRVQQRHVSRHPSFSQRHDNNTNTTITHCSKVDAIRQGTALVLECRRLGRFDAPALAAAAKLLQVVPEVRSPGAAPAAAAAWRAGLHSSDQHR